MIQRNVNSETENRRAVWSQVCTDYYQLALDFARRRVGNSDAAFGVVQDSTVRLLRFLPDHKHINDRRNYWFKTVSNLCNDLLTERKLAAARTVSLDTPPDDDDVGLAYEPTDPGRDPEMNAQINEETEILLAELESHCNDLTKRECALLSLRLQCFSNEQIASAWGEDLNVIRADMNAILAKIRYRVLHAKGSTKRKRKDIRKAKFKVEAESGLQRREVPQTFEKNQQSSTPKTDSGLLFDRPYVRVRRCDLNEIPSY
jgi:DNA-directed RNA polymerase specialized sigma24 family protein